MWVSNTAASPRNIIAIVSIYPIICYIYTRTCTNSCVYSFRNSDNCDVTTEEHVHQHSSLIFNIILVSRFFFPSAESNKLGTKLMNDVRRNDVQTCHVWISSWMTWILFLIVCHVMVMSLLFACISHSHGILGVMYEFVRKIFFRCWDFGKIVYLFMQCAVNVFPCL